MKNYKNTEKALELAKNYANLNENEIKRLSADSNGNLFEINADTENMTYVFYIDLAALDVLGFDSRPVSA